MPVNHLTLRSGNYTLKLDTVGLTSVGGSGTLPSGYVTIPLDILNPGGRGLLPSTQAIPSSEYSLANAYTLDHHLYLDNNGIEFITFAYGNDAFIQFTPGLYSDAMFIQGGVIPPELQPEGGTFQPDGYQGKLWVPYLHPFYNFIETPTEFLYPPTLGVALPEITNWTIDPVSGLDVVHLDLPISRRNADLSTSTESHRTEEHLACRFNEADLGGLAIPPSTQPGTFNDPVDAMPQAVFRLNGAPSSPITSAEATFLKGSIADFPIGQRLRTVGLVAIEGYGTLNDNISNFSWNAELGVLRVAAGGYSKMQYPVVSPEQPNIDANLFTAEIPLGTCGQWSWDYYDGSPQLLRAIVTMRKA